VAAPDLTALLAALPSGRTLWIEVRGRSMWPLLMPGDRLKVQRCAAATLRAGDIAIMAGGDGALVCHPVVSTQPFTTASITGRADVGLEPLARATHVARGERTWSFPRGLVLTFQRVWSALARSPAQAAWQAALAVATSERTTSLRQAALRPVVRPLEPKDLHAVALALSRSRCPAGAALRHESSSACSRAAARPGWCFAAAASAGSSSSATGCSSTRTCCAGCGASGWSGS
jgi:hypothetical protein